VNNPDNQKFDSIHKNVNSTEETFRTDMTKKYHTDGRIY